MEWRREPLDWQLAKRLSRVMREGDIVECWANGMSPYRSMEWAIDFGGGESWAVMEDDERVPVGAFGWTRAGAIWSYWQDLTPEQTKELMRWTPKMVFEMVARAGQTLANYVWVENRPAVTWLRASHCFNIALDADTFIDNKVFRKFETKPLEELRRYV